MERQRKFQKVLTVIICFAALQLLFGGALEQLAALLTGEDMAAFLLYMNTGRLVSSAAEPPSTPTEPDQTQPPETTVPRPALPAFYARDAALADIHNETGYDPALEALIVQPLQWDLTAGEPTVLIVHTHATESYCQSEGFTYTPSSKDRTLDQQYNMVRVGAHLAALLREQGIGVIHDTTLHDYPSYTGSYNHTRNTIRSYLEQHPTIQLVLDLHRDAVELDDGTQLTTHVEVDGEQTAKLMMVVGTDDGGLSHPHWEDNLALALKLHAQLEKNNPGICRFLSFRQERFNQDLSPGAILIEVGAAGDTLPQALRATEYLAQAITQLRLGTTAGSED